MYDDGSSQASVSETSSQVDVEKSPSKNTTTAEVVPVTEPRADTPTISEKAEVTRTELKRVFRRAAWYSLALTAIVAILGTHVPAHARCTSLLTASSRAFPVIVPIPMFFSHYVFSKGFYTFWVACTM